MKALRCRCARWGDYLRPTNGWRGEGADRHHDPCGEALSQFVARRCETLRWSMPKAGPAVRCILPICASGDEP